MLFYVWQKRGEKEGEKRAPLGRAPRKKEAKRGRKGSKRVGKKGASVDKLVN